ncbi:hydroxymethylglutaryl-CoA synthase family protein [Ichthyobacterium seriolicida]|uniref:Hydroxymethylglutaryl-CoA synthase n=1 Tax=Ichthyobacterium seriolicida TaxID=242600 RepID=A0A1J1DZI7_9FLAO|nr:hydroxymethylglutaryl-CoA synthase [Ichthyobacterium seriolicida]BAV94085.1 hydroxymethylglutaryl-CoA synthase [Ichthyobacterium seriolicida]
MNNLKTPVGIDDMAFYVPNIFLPIEVLAEKRNIEPEKLAKGLGLNKMSFLDVHEDTATMAANALLWLIDKNGINPKDIGRIYLATESALDNSKPTSTYVLKMLSDKLQDKKGFENCDVLDMIFACISGVDALHNCVDWIKVNPSKMAVVITSDFAKYDLESTGEYTQGAGAVAILLKAEPRLLTIGDSWGIASEGVFDFFKPKRSIKKADIINDIIKLISIDNEAKKDIIGKMDSNPEICGMKEQSIEIIRDMPVFEGQYSNKCYQEQIKKAYFNFVENKKSSKEEENYLNVWEQIIFHLPYAFHGKRILTELFFENFKGSDLLKDIETETGLEFINSYLEKSDLEKENILKAISKNSLYENFVKQKIKKSEYASKEIGNMYTSSIFMALMSFLEKSLEYGNDISDKTIGFISYGSGSKSKIFEATINRNWKIPTKNFFLFETLSKRTSIDYDTYEKLHKRELKNSVIPPTKEFYLKHIDEDGIFKGSRHYEFK